MPRCIEDTITASHRPILIALPTYVLLEAISSSASLLSREPGEPAPSDAAIQGAMNLVAEIPFSLIGRPQLSPFFGEIHLSWSHGAKQVVLMCFPDRTPMIHHHERIQGAPSTHDIEEASPERVAFWLRWLHD